MSEELKPVYQKPFLPYVEQIDLLKGRGLSFKNEEQAIKILERVSYYRLGCYWHMFLDGRQNKVFKENSSFESAFEIYKFDMNLRKIIIAEIEKIEVAFRSKMAHVLSLSNGSFWLEEKSLFSKSSEHKSLVLKVKEEIKRSDESLIASFKKEYSNDIPPTFMLLEITSFGTLSKLYKNLKSSKEKQEIASFFGLFDKAFESWLYSLVYVRNVCAHYARLWNRKMRIIPVHPSTHKNQWLNNRQIPNNRIYFILSMLIYLLNIINPKHSFKQKLNALFLKYPIIDKPAMGFPANWQKEPLWVSV